MFSTYNEFAPLAVLLTLILVFIIGRGITREDLKSVDGTFAAFGVMLGLIATFMNLVYISNELFLLSFVIPMSSTLYLRYRSKFKVRSYNSLLQMNKRTRTIISVAWWSLISITLIVNYFSEPYTRHLFFFLLISGAVALLGVQIIATKYSSTITSPIFIFKILLLSVILRSSGYLISPYPVGSDGWVHRGYISYFLEFGQITVPSGFMQNYVIYPIAHLYATCATLLGSISVQDATFLLGLVLTFSTIITFLIVRLLAGNVQLALISMLLLNFADVHIRWSIQPIAMSFGLAIYAFIIFFALKISLEPEDKLKYIPFMLVFVSVVVWTHTISAFITLASLFALIAGYILYGMLYNQRIFPILNKNIRMIFGFFLILALIMIYHWMDPLFPFFDQTLAGLLRSLSQDAGFLGAVSLSNVAGQWGELLRPLGFSIYVFSGIIGTLYCLSNRELAKRCFPLVFLTFTIFFISYTFSAFGMRDIVPDRWPAFAFVCFTLFIGLGIVCSLSWFKSQRAILCVVAIFLFVGSFFMITNGMTNHDSPLFGEETVVKLIWTESEMVMHTHINEVYDGTIIADSHTAGRVFTGYLRTDRTAEYMVTQEGQINERWLSQGLVIWRKDSLSRPVACHDGKYITSLLLGENFYRYLDANCSCLFDVSWGRGFLPS